MIRPLQPHELDDLLDLYKHLHRNDLPLPDRATVESVWQNVLANPNCRYFGAFDRDELISSCTIVLVPNLTRGCRPYGLIENVVTHSAHRGKGWGKRVLEAALEFAWSNDCYKVMLLTGRKEESVRRFYEGAGFSSDGKVGFIAKPISV
jgi:GNAT superfamily N-acetyltransferase